MRELELLAPARNADIGIAAIDCGADAVYIAGPRFGARQAAGNEMDDIRRLCEYAHRYGARVFVTLNTIIYDEELEQAREMMKQMQEAGADAVIVQDMAIPLMAAQMNDEVPGTWTLPLHASTQCDIRTPQKAAFLEEMGFSRLILEREMSLQQIREIASSSECEIEFFVHGALCVCYSGQCYLSEKIAGRSANRGACIQACRSKYDLFDKDGHCIVKNKALLSLKDYNLKSRLADLAEAGVTSFKIEGRLKNEAYVRNVVRDYSLALDRLVEAQPDKYVRASFGRVEGGFTPDSDKTFNRGYTELFIDGRKGQWAAMDAAKSMGEELGTVCRLNRECTRFGIRPSESGIVLHNGDGLCFIDSKGEVVGVRADVCEGLEVRCKATAGLHEGAKIYRNFDFALNKAMENAPCRRLVGVSVDISFKDAVLGITARSEDGRIVRSEYRDIWTELATNEERMRSMMESQLSKTSGIYRFHLKSIRSEDGLPLLSSSALNAMRNDLAARIDSIATKRRAMLNRPPRSSMKRVNELKSVAGGNIAYKENVANKLAQSVYQRAAGEGTVEPAYELSHREGAELMRSRYCIRHELGLCPKQGRAASAEPLFLLNNGRRLTLRFDCQRCEMTVLT